MSMPRLSNKPLSSSAGGSPGLRGRLVFIDALRGLAALMIAMHHIDRYEPLTIADTSLPQWMLMWLKEGRVAVEVFFVISGFMIAYSLRQMILTPAAMGRFSLRRLIRLGLPYWTILAVVLVLDALLPWIGLPCLNSEIYAGQFVSEVFFLQDILGYGSTSTGLWFICIEVQFLVLFLALLWLAQRLQSTKSPTAGRTGSLARLAVFAPLALLSLFLFNVDPQYDVWIVFFFGTLFLGTMTCWALDGSVPRAAFWLYVLAALVRLAVCPGLRLAVALSAALLIYAVGRMGKLNSWLSARWLQYLGGVSYSLFLVHYAVCHVVKCFGHRLTEKSPDIAIAWLGLALVASVVVAHFFHRYVEMPACQVAEQFKQSVPAVLQESLPCETLQHEC
jgi:peptidoglycan/LPS O-acetylase OafA/YrhL